MRVITNSTSAPLGDITASPGTPGTYRGPCFHIAGVTCPNCAPVVRKSSSCPYCTPRCPHGYPADVAPLYPTPFYPATPWFTITSVAYGDALPVNGLAPVVNYDSAINPNVDFTYTSH